MSRHYSYKCFCICLLFAVAVLFNRTGTAGEKPPGHGPVEITSSTLSADNKANTALFEGSVVAKTREITLYSDRMTVFYSEDGMVEKIKAEGSVKLIKGEQVVTSGKAVYFAAQQKVVFTDNPRAVKGGNVIAGSKMTYLIEDDRSLVENSKVFLEQKKGQ